MPEMKSQSIRLPRAITYIMIVADDAQIEAIAAYAQARETVLNPMPLYCTFLYTLNKLSLPDWFWNEYDYQNRHNAIEDFENDLADGICNAWLRRQLERAQNAGAE